MSSLQLVSAICGHKCSCQMQNEINSLETTVAEQESKLVAMRHQIRDLEGQLQQLQYERMSRVPEEKSPKVGGSHLISPPREESVLKHHQDHRHHSQHTQHTYSTPVPKRSFETMKNSSDYQQPTREEHIPSYTSLPPLNPTEPRFPSEATAAPARFSPKDRDNNSIMHHIDSPGVTGSKALASLPAPITTSTSFPDPTPTALPVPTNVSTHATNIDDQSAATYKRKSKPVVPGICISCKTTTSPCWRRSWGEAKLCNPCGLRYAKTRAYCQTCNRVASKRDSPQLAGSRCSCGGNFVL